MKLIASLAIVLSTGCATYTSPDGRTQSSLNPLVAGVLEAGLSSGLGMATGALMNSAPGWANGGVSAAVGSIGTQVVGAITKPGGGNYGNAGYAGYGQPAPGYYPAQAANPYQGQQPVYYRAGGGLNPSPQYPAAAYPYTY
jgi:hypothetical protein